MPPCATRDRFVLSYTQHEARDANKRGEDVSWDRRLREMLLAGGTIATAACGGAVHGSDFDASASGDATTGQDAGDELSNNGGFCCNADPDPCCEYELCDASLTPQCAQELQCQEAGLWNSSTFSCERPPVDAGPADAGVDVVSSSGPCCNGNPDPCCPFELCDAAASPACTCELEGGVWDSQAGSDDSGLLVGACQSPSAGEAGADGGSDAPEGSADGS